RPLERGVADRSAIDTQRNKDSHGQVEVTVVDRPTLRGAQVVDLRTQPGDPFKLVRPTQMRTGVLGKTGEVLCVATLHDRNGVGLIEAVVGILANGLEQAITRVA